MSFDAATNAGTTDLLEFLLVRYDINGTFKGVERLMSQMSYCQQHSGDGIGSSATPLWLRFGVSMTSQYLCNLEALDPSRLELYELFLVDGSKSEGDAGRYVPVPVQNTNYQDSKGLYVNRNTKPSDTTDDFLTHRFFLYDFQSGVPVGSTKAKVYRYAQRITLAIKTQPSNVASIYPPLLSISYVDTMAPSNTTIEFQVVYSSDTSKFWSSAVALFSVACVLGGLRTLVQMFTWQRRNTRNEETGTAMWHSLLRLVLCGMANFAILSFLVLFALCLYFLLFFKLQSSLFVLLPEPNYQAYASQMDDYYPFRVLVPLTCVFQLLIVVHHIHEQTQMQLFFIDWEKPRSKLLDMDTAKPKNAPVSVWRTILVANEWNELQTIRRTSFRFTLITLLFLLYGFDLRLLALPLPQVQMQYVSATVLSSTSTLSSDSSLHTNVCLRFAIVSSLWLLICIVQRLWNWLIYERFFDEPRELLFIDLCTVAKVSCFLLDERYHGFYLHCRSPYPFADGSMSEIVNQLKQEEAGLTVGRGLDTTLPDCQAFEVFFTRRWRRKYQSLFNSMRTGGGPVKNQQDQSQHQRQFGVGRGQLRQGGSLQSWQHALRSSHSNTTQAMVQHSIQLSAFLKSFIENQDEQFRWRIYRAGTPFTRLFDIPPDMSFTKQSFFLPGRVRIALNSFSISAEDDFLLAFYRHQLQIRPSAAAWNRK